MAEVPKGEALGALGVRGREKDAELATAAAVGGGERRRGRGGTGGEGRKR